MKLHLPVLLRKAIIACMLAVVTSYTQTISAATLTLGGDDSLSLDFADESTIPNLNNGSLQLSGGTTLQLSSCGEGDGKTYTLFTGVSSLLDAEGNPITPDDTNNAASLYFDTTHPGSGFWADGELMLVNGALQLVLHNGEVKAAETITIWSEKGEDYSYYAGVTFRDIESECYGGPNYGGGTVALRNNGNVVFEGNTTRDSSAYTYAFAFGGAIYGSRIELSNNGNVVFKRNEVNITSVSDSYVTTYADGGAIYVDYDGMLGLSNNASVTFADNMTSSISSYTSGGAIYGNIGSMITLSNNGSVVFEGNTASSTDYYAEGGAIYGYSNSTITLSNNESVEFSGNTASGKYADGGAIYGYEDSTITLSNNGSVEFRGNTASGSSSARGGAIYGGDITLSNNGNVEFRGNSASGTSSAYGSAIYGRSITLNNNGSVEFIGNTASGRYTSGGAIGAHGDLSIRNNDSVLFEKNAEVEDGFYCLRSIDVSGNGQVISFSTALGKSIEFRDSIYIADGSTFNLNADYTDATGNTHKQQGDIIFTGAYVAEHLAEVKGSDGTKNEILNSQSSMVYCMTNLYGGRLLVEDGAIYQGYGITVHEGSGATLRVKDAELNHRNYILTFHSGTALELAGLNTITGTVQMSGNSSLVFDLSESQEMTSVSEAFNLNGELSVSTRGEAVGDNVILLYAKDGINGWEENARAADGKSYTMVSGDLLVMNYNADTFQPYFLGDYEISSLQRGNALKHYQSVYGSGLTLNGVFKMDDGDTLALDYNGSVTFSGHATSVTHSSGGVINGGNTSMTNNGSVTFSGNTASGSSSSGGAINGLAASFVNNGSVMFSRNAASTSGGAINVERVTLRDNDSIEFSGNTVSGSSSTGGAINGGSVSLDNNGIVVFRGNTASSTGGAIYAAGDLSICNNDSVLFDKNTETNYYGSYLLRSIYAGGNRKTVSLSAAAGKSIEFRDSIYIGDGNTFNLNKTFEDIEQKGDILFTGKTTENDLYEVKGNAAGTEYEIRSSLTSIVYTETNLYGGRLRVEDGAIYNGRGITAHEGSGATLRVKDATLGHGIYNLTFNSGTTLELAGCNSITGNVQMQGGSSLVFDLSESQEVTTVYGSLTLDGAIDVSARGNAGADNTLLLYVENGISGWMENTTGADRASYTLIGNYIVKNYNAASFQPYSLGEYIISSLQQGGGIMNHYNSVRGSGQRNGVIKLSVDDTLEIAYNKSVTFSQNSGAVIYGDGRSRITLSDNESVTFNENSEGAITTNGDIELCENGGVVFSENSDGAITANGNIMLNDNGSVVFSKNSGGAIGTHGNLSICNNDSVLFEKNVEHKDGSYYLRSINASGSDNVISLSAAAGKSIEFRDSICIGEGCSFNLNKSFGGIQHTGDILFSGKFTEKDLYSVKGNVAGTAEEIRLSRTSEVNALTNLYGGRLRVEDGAVYTGYGITAIAGFGATVRVKDAELSHSGYNLTFNAGTTLELAGTNSISGNVEMSNGSVLRFDCSSFKGTTNISGNLTLDASSTIMLESTDSWGGENYVFLQVEGNIIAESETNAGGQDSYTRVKNLFVWNYNEGTFNPFFKGALTLTSRQSNAVEYYNYDKLEFSGISSSAHGAAICGATSINWCNEVVFSSNISYTSPGYTCGGAIYGKVSMIGNNTISFIGNKTDSRTRSSYWSYGGAIDGDVLMSDNGEVSFIGNSAGESGGAIRGTVSMNNNERVCFIGNAVTALSDEVRGGAVYGSISMHGNDYVLFDSNTSEWSGGALYVSSRESVTLSGNSCVEFIGNSAYQSGGAIYGGSNSSIVLSNNGSVLFRDNAAYVDGAIYTNGNLYIQNNDYVLFENNARVRSSFLSLRSIYAAGGSNSVISLSAPAGKCIEFRDPIYISSNCTFNLNADYVNEAGICVRQQGDIIFSAAASESPGLNAGDSSAALVANVSSRTSEVNALVNLYGGSLRVEENAIFKGYGITAHENSDAAVLVKNATLNHTGHSLTFASGTSLKLADDYKLYARSLVMNEGSSLLLDASTSRGQLVLSGDLTMNGNVGITLSPDTQSTDENLLFMYVDGSVSGWNPRRVTVSGTDSCDASDFTWIDHCLILNYNAATYKPYLFLFEQQEGGVAYSDYAGVFFGGSSPDAQQAAISGSAGDLIHLCSNDKVEFHCNAAGAIYGDGSTIVVDDNACVVFSGNESAYAGAVYGGNASTISICGNSSVTLQENESGANGGAICVSDGSIAIDNNGAVSVCENVAVSSGGGLYGYGSSISLNNNGKVLFSGNTAAEGCGISGYACHISVNNNEQIEFVGNICSSYYGGGVVICASSGSSVEMNGNGSVVFNGNYGASYGGAVYVDSDSSFLLNRNASVSFCGNTAEGGGAIYGGTQVINDNGEVLFCGNTAYDYEGGAIMATNDLSIRNNDSVLFEKNLDVKYGDNDAANDSHYLRSIYVQSNSSADAREVSFSAAQDKRIEFRDSIYVSEDVSFSLNADYVDSSGKRIKQQGDVIFTGAYTEAHLAEMKGSSGTADEILNSRTAEVYTMTNLYGGRLRIESGAIYKGNGITVAENSDAAVWLRNAQLQHQGYNISFGKGTTFGLRGCNISQSDNISMAAGSSLSFEIGVDNLSTAVLTHTGALTLGGRVTLNIGAADDSLALGQYKLLQVTDSAALENWSNENLLMGDDSYTVADFEWVDNTLCFNYSGQQLSGLPLLPEIPEEPEIPDTPVTPDEPEIPDSPVTPDDPEIPDTPVSPDEPEIPDTPVTPDEPEIPDTPVTPDEPEIPDTPVAPDEPEIPDTPVTPDEPEKPEQLKPLRPGSKPVLVGGDIDKNTEIILTEKGNVTLEGKVNAGAINVKSDANITFKSNKKKPGSLTGDGDLTKSGKGTLTLNDGNTSWSGDTYLKAGTIKVKGATSLGKGDVYVQGGTMNLGSKAVSNDIVQSGNAAIKSGKKFTGTYALECGELLKGSTLNISRKATLEGGTVNGTLTGNGTATVTGNVKLGDKGKITTKALTLGEDAKLTTSAKGLSSKATTLTIGEDALFSLGGKMTVDALKINGGELKTTASKPAAMTVKNNMELTGATLTTNGKVTTNRLTLNESTMTIKGAKAQNLTVKQSLTLGSGSNLRLNGKLSAGSLTIKSGGTLTMSGSKPVTLKVKGALTLNSGSSIILDYDFVQGKTYKVLTFGSYSGSKDYYSIFGVDADDCTITNTGKALTLTVTGKWNPQTQQKAVSAETPVVSAAKSNPVADALVQSNWGQLEASRAFVNAMANRSMAVQLGNGERAVWASAIGASSRHSSAGGHADADTNVSGGAFGLETQVGRASLLGMALGNSWTRVSAHGFGTIEQDTTHLGLYGQTNWRSGVTADWSAAYGRSDSETMGTDWSQKHVQLDGRVSYNHELNANTLLSPFAGMQYYASDSATVDGTSTGSLQNLRAEIGVVASRRMGKFGVYGEIALHQDIARNNPTVSMEGVRYTGMNPGRTGLNFTVGASYELSDKWSVNASYTGEFVENANAHSANIGATYKF